MSSDNIQTIKHHPSAPCNYGYNQQSYQYERCDIEFCWCFGNVDSLHQLCDDCAKYIWELKDTQNDYQEFIQ